MVFDIGPFRLYRVEKNGTLCISLIAFDDYSFGWEYGYADPMRGETHPWLSLRIKKLNIFSFETWKWGFEIWFMGFWWIV